MSTITLTPEHIATLEKIVENESCARYDIKCAECPMQGIDHCGSEADVAKALLRMSGQPWD